MVGPLALSLKARHDGIVTECLFTETTFGQTRVTHHQVPHNYRALYYEVPFPIFAFTTAWLIVVVSAFDTIRRSPRMSGLELFLIIDFFFHAAGQLGHIHSFHPHAEEIFEEILIHNGASNAHRNGADGQIRLSANAGYRQAC